MAVVIEQKEDDVFTINDKHVYINSEGKIVALQELTVGEFHAFSNHLKSINKLV